ncbi:unnamed protein product [Boreogadus saida]
MSYGVESGSPVLSLSRSPPSSLSLLFIFNLLASSVSQFKATFFVNGLVASCVFIRSLCLSRSLSLSRSLALSLCVCVCVCVCVTLSRSLPPQRDVELSIHHNKTLYLKSPVSVSVYSAALIG